MGGTVTLPRVHVYATATPGTMDVVIREGVCAVHPNEAWIVLGGTGHEGATGALQAVALLPAMNQMQAEVACHEKLAALGHKMQMRVARRQSIETVLLLSWFTRGADTPAELGQEAAFFPDLQPLRSADTPAELGNFHGEHMRWTVGDDYLASFPPGEVSWQFHSMPRSLALPRTTFNARVAAALRLIMEKRLAAMRLPLSPGSALMRPFTNGEFKTASAAIKDVFAAIWHNNVTGASQCAGESNKQYRGRFRGAFRAWAKALYADEAVLNELLKFGFGSADTPAKALGRAMRAHNDHAKQNRKDNMENRETELQEYTARKTRRALRFGNMSEEALTAHQRGLLQRLQAGELRMPKPDLQGYTFQ